jgi:hypothetical protein
VEASGQTFTYTITDSASNTSTGTVTLNVTEAGTLTTEYFTADENYAPAQITYINEFNQVVVQDIYAPECVPIAYKEIISSYGVIPCTP